MGKCGGDGEAGLQGGTRSKIRNCQERKTQLLTGRIENEVRREGGNGVAIKLRSGVERYCN